MGLTWRTILMALGTATELVRSAKTLRESVEDLREKRKPEPLPPLPANADADTVFEDLRARVARLETNESRQAELVARLAEQTQTLTKGLQLLAARVEKVYWMAFAALGLAVLLALIGLSWIFLR